VCRRGKAIFFAVRVSFRVALEKIIMKKKEEREKKKKLVMLCWCFRPTKQKNVFRTVFFTVEIKVEPRTDSSWTSIS